MSSAKIVYTHTDEAPALATYSLLPIIRAMTRMPRFKPLSLMNRNRGVFGINLAHLWDEQARLAQFMNQLLDEVNAGRLRMVVSRSFPLDDAAAAHRFLQSRANVGKVVLTTS